MHHLPNKNEPKSIIQNVSCPIQQGLADENPDVDAVYRMTLKLPIKFDQHNSLALGKMPGHLLIVRIQHGSEKRFRFCIYHLTVHSA